MTSIIGLNQINSLYFIDFSLECLIDNFAEFLNLGFLIRCNFFNKTRWNFAYVH